MPPNTISIEKVYDLLDNVNVDKQFNDYQIISEVVGHTREGKSK